MKKPIQISIPTPCHENWDAMTPADKGRFCASCQKTVHDFTNSSDREIASILKSTNNACGRFRTTQLDRNLVLPKEKSSLWMAASAAVVSFLTIGNHTVSAQTPVNTSQRSSETDEIIGKIYPPQARIITGKVTDIDGLPIPDFFIRLKNSKKEALTKMDGSFAIEANIGDTIITEYVGFEECQTTVTSNNYYEIILNEDICEDCIPLIGAIAPMKERTFFVRIFHSIGNIFR